MPTASASPRRPRCSIADTDRPLGRPRDRVPAADRGDGEGARAPVAARPASSTSSMVAPGSRAGHVRAPRRLASRATAGGDAPRPRAGHRAVFGHRATRHPGRAASTDVRGPTPPRPTASGFDVVGVLALPEQFVTDTLRALPDQRSGRGARPPRWSRTPLAQRHDLRPGRHGLHRRRAGDRGRARPGGGGPRRSAASGPGGGARVTVVVRTQGLTKRYPGGLLAVDGIDLEVHEGDLFGFLGPNGSGKTHHHPDAARPGASPTAGHGRAARASRARAAPTRRCPTSARWSRARRSTRTCPGAGNLAAASTPPAVRAAAPRPRRRRSTTRSSGSAWRTSAAGRCGPTRWACASGSAWPPRCCASPRLLILDEPTNGLDPQGIHEVRGAASSSCVRAGTTVFLSSHLLAEVELICTRAAMMASGRLVAQDRVADAPGARPGRSGIESRRRRGRGRRRAARTARSSGPTSAPAGPT